MRMVTFSIRAHIQVAFRRNSGAAHRVAIDVAGLEYLRQTNYPPASRSIVPLCFTQAAPANRMLINTWSAGGGGMNLFTSFPSEKETTRVRVAVCEP